MFRFLTCVFSWFSIFLIFEIATFGDCRCFDVASCLCVVSSTFVFVCFANARIFDFSKLRCFANFDVSNLLVLDSLVRRVLTFRFFDFWIFVLLFCGIFDVLILRC